MRPTQRLPHNVFSTGSQTFSSPVRKTQNTSFHENRIQEDGGTEQLKCYSRPVCVCACVRACVCVCAHAFYIFLSVKKKSCACNFITEALQVIHCAKSLYLFGFLKTQNSKKNSKTANNVPYTSTRCVYKLPRTIGQNTQSKLNLCDVVTEILLSEL